MLEGMTGSSPAAYDDGRASYAGWIAGAIVTLGVLAVGAALWFTYHP